MKVLLTVFALSLTLAGARAEEAAAPAAGDVTELKLAVDPANPLKFDTAAFSVKAGAKVKLVFKNNATIPQPHNVLILAPGSLAEISAAAMSMAADPAAMQKGYIPESPKVLHHSKLLQVGEEETLEFDAPAEAGEYPFVCTFPGHAALMNGVLTVE